MGMYDSIIIDQSVDLPKLPGLETFPVNGLDFQTKDLYCELASYKLANGILVKFECDRIFVKDEKHILGGYYEIVPDSKRWKECNHVTDYIYFYTHFDNITESQDAWIEYVAHIREGKIVDIKLHKFDLKSNSARLESEKRFHDMMVDSVDRTKLQKFFDDLRFFIRVNLHWISKKHIDLAYWINNQINKI